MNCLLLLIILFCCNGNGGCNTRGCYRTNGRRENSCVRNHVAREDGCERRDNRRECDASPCVHTHTPPPMPRTQFPYLDVEPRTCGCEENK